MGFNGVKPQSYEGVNKATLDPTTWFQIHPISAMPGAAIPSLNRKHEHTFNVLWRWFPFAHNYPDAHRCNCARRRERVGNPRDGNGTNSESLIFRAYASIQFFSLIYNFKLLDT